MVEQAMQQVQCPDINREQGLNYFIKYVLCLGTTMLRKFENENKNQNKENLRLKIYGKIKNGRRTLEPSVLIKNRVLSTMVVHFRVTRRRSVTLSLYW